MQSSIIVSIHLPVVYVGRSQYQGRSESEGKKGSIKSDHVDRITVSSE